MVGLGSLMECGERRRAEESPISVSAYVEPYESEQPVEADPGEQVSDL